MCHKLENVTAFFQKVNNFPQIFLTAFLLEHFVVTQNDEMIGRRHGLALKQIVHVGDELRGRLLRQRVAVVFPFNVPTINFETVFEQNRRRFASRLLPTAPNGGRCPNVASGHSHDFRSQIQARFVADNIVGGVLWTGVKMLIPTVSVAV